MYKMVFKSFIIKRERGMTRNLTKSNLKSYIDIGYMRTYVQTERKYEKNG